MRRAPRIFIRPLAGVSRGAAASLHGFVESNSRRERWTGARDRDMKGNLAVVARISANFQKVSRYSKRGANPVL
jgi:hypothetical protein